MATKALTFTSPERTWGKVTPFELDGETLEAVQPKAATLLAITQSIDMTDEFAQAQLIDDFIDLCMTEETAARLRQRMADPEDAFDLDVLTTIIRGLQEVWAARPTGPSGRSSGRPKRTGLASTARAPRTA